MYHWSWTSHKTPCGGPIWRHAYSIRSLCFCLDLHARSLDFAARPITAETSSAVGNRYNTQTSWNERETRGRKGPSCLLVRGISDFWSPWMPSKGIQGPYYTRCPRSGRFLKDLLTNQRGLNPGDTVNMIYRHSRQRHSHWSYPRDASLHSIRNLTYSLFYRSRKDVRQLKDSLDLLRGCLAIGKRERERERGEDRAGNGLTSRWKTLWNGNGSMCPRETPRRGHLTLYRRCPTKGAFSYARKRPSTATRIVIYNKLYITLVTRNGPARLSPETVVRFVFDIAHRRIPSLEIHVFDCLHLVSFFLAMEQVFKAFDLSFTTETVIIRSPEIRIYHTLNPYKFINEKVKGLRKFGCVEWKLERFGLLPVHREIIN